MRLVLCEGISKIFEVTIMSKFQAPGIVSEKDFHACNRALLRDAEVWIRSGLATCAHVLVNFMRSNKRLPVRIAQAFLAAQCFIEVKCSKRRSQRWRER